MKFIERTESPLKIHGQFNSTTDFSLDEDNIIHRDFFFTVLFLKLLNITLTLNCFKE